jgi:hypothetical protein
MGDCWQLQRDAKRVYDGDIDRPCQSAMMSRMTPESLYINERIGRPADEVYEYAVDPETCPNGLLGSPAPSRTSMGSGSSKRR